MLPGAENSPAISDLRRRLMAAEEQLAGERAGRKAVEEALAASEQAPERLERMLASLPTPPTGEGERHSCRRGQDEPRRTSQEGAAQAAHDLEERPACCRLDVDG